MTSPDVRPRPGGRSSRVRRAVYDAALEALENRQARQVTIPEIAARANVHPTSIYRRWGTLERLLAAEPELQLLAAADEGLVKSVQGVLKTLPS